MAGKVNFHSLDGPFEDQLATLDAFLELNKEDLERWRAEHPEEAEEDDNSD